MIEAIVKAVTEVYGVTPEAITGKSRKAPLPEARRMIVSFIKKYEYDNEDAVKAVNRHRTYWYKANEVNSNEIKIYVNLAKKHIEVQKKINELTSKTK